LPLSGFESGSSTPNPSHYTDYTVLAVVFALYKA